MTSAPAANLADTDLALITAVNNENILAQCLARSQDVATGRLALTAIRGARSMAEAYNAGLQQTSGKVAILAHQDVYLPVGWLDRAKACLDALSDRHPDWMVAGAYGVRDDGVHVGRVWDAVLGCELGGPGFGPAPVASLDELLLILRRDTGYRFDPQLPDFHLYGTDLVQECRALGRSAWAVEVPVVHNNQPVASLTGGYASAYRYARDKWRDRLPIPTTICALSRSPLPLLRAQWRRRHAAPRTGNLLHEAATLARAAGYERD